MIQADSTDYGLIFWSDHTLQILLRVWYSLSNDIHHMTWFCQGWDPPRWGSVRKELCQGGREFVRNGSGRKEFCQGIGLPRRGSVRKEFCQALDPPRMGSVRKELCQGGEGVLSRRGSVKS